MNELKLSVPINRMGSGAPLFIVPSAATTPLSLALLARSVIPPRPIYSFVFPELDDKRFMPQSVKEMGARFISELKSIQPEGPYFIAGHCFGATPAIEIVSQLEAAGDSVALLTLIEAFAIGIAEPEGSSPSSSKIDQTNLADFETAIHDQISQMGDRLGMLPLEVREDFVNITTHHVKMAFAYRAKPVATPIFLFRTSQHPESIFKDWESVTSRGFFESIIPGTTDSILKMPDVTALASGIGDALERFS